MHTLAVPGAHQSCGERDCAAFRCSASSLPLLSPLGTHRCAAGDEVTLLFTVTGSGAFQGCAKMKSAAGRDGVSCDTQQLGLSFRRQLCTCVFAVGL